MKIKLLLDNFSGLKSEPYGNRTRKTISIEVSSNEDIANYISELLKVCYYCLDGNGVFISPADGNSLPESSVTKVIELVLNLIPHEQMHCIDRITEILQNMDKSDEKKKYNKKSDREKLEVLTGLLSPRIRRDKGLSQEVTFKVKDNSELRYVISCLLRVSISALELEGTSSSPRMPYFSNELAPASRYLKFQLGI